MPTQPPSPSRDTNTRGVLVRLHRLYLYRWLLLIVTGLLPQLSNAGTCVSIASGNWSTTTTWNCTGSNPPTSTDTVRLASGYNVTGTAATIAALTIDSGATLTMNNSNALTVTGNIVINGTVTSPSSNGSGILASSGNAAVISGTGTISGTARLYTSGSAPSIAAGSVLAFTSSASMRIGRNANNSTVATSVLTINGTLNGAGQTGGTGTSMLRIYSNNTVIGSTGVVTGAGIDISYRTSGVTLTNNGTVNVKTISSTGKWVNAANSALTVTSSMASTVTLTAYASGNTVTWTSPATARPTVSNTYFNLAGTGVVCPVSFTVLGTSPCAATPYVASYPSTCVSSTEVGSVAWTNPGNATSVNSTVASAALAGNTSNYLKCSGFNLAVPTGSTINGITVYLTRSTADSNSPDRDAYVYLIKGGTISTTMNGATQNTWTTTSQTEGHGGVGSLWGTSWTYADLNSANFGVAIAAKNSSSRDCSSGSGNYCSAFIDAVQIRVDYTPPPSLHHVRIEYKGTGSTCDPSPITLKACANAACTTNYTGADISNIVLTTTNSDSAGSTAWSPSSTATISAAQGGINSALRLSATTTSNVTMGISGTTSPAPSAPYDCLDTTTGATSCTIAFSALYLTYYPPNHVAGTSQSVTVTSCSTTFASTSKSINFWSTYNDPSTGTQQAKVTPGSGNACAGTALSTSASSPTPISLSFGAGAAPQATLSICYPDVGKVTLNSLYTDTTNNITITGSGSFITRPDHFTLSNIKRTSNSLTNPAAANATGAAFTAAGNSTFSAAAFSATVSAKNASNVTTPNFGRESTPQGVLMVVNTPVISPSGGATGMLTCSGSINNCIVPGGSSFSSGSATVTDLAWNEVGVMQILPTMASGSYMGTGEIGTPTVSGNIGRFFAHHYSVAPSSNSPISNRADLCAGGFSLTNTSTACDAFTYMGESFALNFDILAQSADGNVLNNYNSSATAADNYARFNLSSLNNTASTNTLGIGMFDSNTSTALTSRVTVATTATGSFLAGSATVAVSASMARASAPDGPYDAVTVGAAPIDADGAATDPGSFDMSVTGSSTNDHTTLGVTALRFGRLWLGNGYGQSSRNQAIPVQAQYWSGSSFITNALDNLTVLSKSSLGLCNLSSTAFGTSFGLGNLAAGPYALSAGLGSISVTAPGATGSATLLMDLGSTSTANVACTPSTAPTAGPSLGYLRNRWYGSTYDRDPTSTVTFGVNGGRKGHLYIRESY